MCVKKYSLFNHFFCSSSILVWNSPLRMNYWVSGVRISTPAHMLCNVHTNWVKLTSDNLFNFFSVGEMKMTFLLLPFCLFLLFSFILLLGDGCCAIFMVSIHGNFFSLHDCLCLEPWISKCKNQHLWFGIIEGKMNFQWLFIC